ncbi:MAG: hypothetical protein HLUCCA12_18230 [Rhodobacteraceae bacterium HLUCCA12]|nr:MAG: hypothetical protein HLUCCA12_18230 [Rhodobacteraceae bacterium HLUCCA12]
MRKKRLVRSHRCRFDAPFDAVFCNAILKKVDGDWMVQRTLVSAVMPGPPSE